MSLGTLRNCCLASLRRRIGASGRKCIVILSEYSPPELDVEWVDDDDDEEQPVSLQVAMANW